MKCRSELFLCLITAAVVTVVVFLPVTARAENNGWHSKAAVGFNLSSGNSDTMLLNVELGTEKKTSSHEFSMGALFAYGEMDDEATAENGKTHAQYNRLFTERSYLYVNSEIGYDRITDLKYRLIAGPGIGRYFIKKENQAFTVELGASYVDEELSVESGDGEMDDTVAIRLVEKYEWAVSKTAKIWQRVEWLPELDEPAPYLLTAELGIEVAVNAGLNLRLMAEDKYDSEPAPGIEKNDLSVKVSLVYNIGR